VGRFLSEDPIRFDAGINFYTYDWNNPANFIDPSGLDGKPWYCHFPIPNCFVYYGNWGGPGWTGGQYDAYEDLTPDEIARLRPPIDDQDACYREHDLCYSQARVANQCTSKARPTKSQRQSQSTDEGSCDFQLQQCLRLINSGSSSNAHSWIAEPLFSIRELIK
jgi:uncharacterized protein RhaS with RHS repeats